VSKTWNAYLSTIRGSSGLTHVLHTNCLLYSHNNIECFQKDSLFLRSLNGYETTKLLIEALEDIPKNNTNSFLKYKKPMTWVMSRKIKNRANLAGLNLMGY
jgi:hypothetical protein